MGNFQPRLLFPAIPTILHFAGGSLTFSNIRVYQMLNFMDGVIGVETIAGAALMDILERNIGSSCMRSVAHFFLDNDLRGLRLDMDILAAKNSAQAVSELRNEFARRELPIEILTRKVPGTYRNKPDTLCEYYFAKAERKPIPQMALPELE